MRITDFRGIPGGARKIGVEFRGGVMKNEIEFQGGMTSENGYPQQGGLRKISGKAHYFMSFSIIVPLFLYAYKVLRKYVIYCHWDSNTLKDNVL